MKTVKTEKCAFAAGCFWGVEESFRKLPGVIATAVGYCGGRTTDPTYEKVCSGRTGHAETVLIEYDPEKLPYEELLALFFDTHDPTTRDRQGPDIGSQYRSVIFYYSPEQEQKARAFVQVLAKAKRFKKKIVTEILPAAPFYRAEEYHQRYFEKKDGGSCRMH